MISANQAEEKHGGVWVYCELRDGRFIQGDFELVSEARKIADDLREKVYCLVVSNSFVQPLQILGGYGADQVLAYRNNVFSEYTTEAYTAAVCEMISVCNPHILLFSATWQGQDLAPRCAARVHTGLTANCFKLDVDCEKYNSYIRQKKGMPEIQREECNVVGNDLKMTRPAFENYMMTTIICPHLRPCMCTIRPGTLGVGAYDEDRARNCRIEMRDFETVYTQNVPTVVEILNKGKKETSIENAETIVCVGRGIAHDPEKGMKLVNRLAAVLAARVAGTRAAVDAGWVNEEHLIGESGRMVRPKLYIGVGVSGAAQHTVGMQKSGTIFAINKNKGAPIFSIADCAMIGDLFQILPILIDELEKNKGMF